jgi:hypothetical protein
LQKCCAKKSRGYFDAFPGFDRTGVLLYKTVEYQEQTLISHVWYYNDTQMAIVDLAVNASPWRTWSSKRIVKDWTGTWRVDVVSASGKIICSEKFVVSSIAE